MEHIEETMMVMLYCGNRNVSVKVEISKIKELQKDVKDGVQDDFMNSSQYDVKASKLAKRQYEPVMIRRRDISMIFVTNESNIAVPQLGMKQPGSKELIH